MNFKVKTFWAQAHLRYRQIYNCVVVWDFVLLPKHLPVGSYKRLLLWRTTYRKSARQRRRRILNKAVSSRSLRRNTMRREIGSITFYWNSLKHIIPGHKSLPLCHLARWFLYRFFIRLHHPRALLDARHYLLFRVYWIKFAID